MKKYLISLLIATSAFASTPTPTPIKISEMPSASSVTGPELVPIVQSGANKKATISVIKTFINPTPTPSATATPTATATPDLGGWTVMTVTGSNATTTGQSLVDVTGLVSATLSNSTKYEIEAILDVSTSADTTGCEYGVQTGGTGSAGIVSVILTGTTTGTSGSDETLSGTPATASTARLLTSAQTGAIILKGQVTTRSTGTATISIQHLKATSGTSTVKIGSTFKYRVAGQ